MSKYLLIESRDLFEYQAPHYFFDLARDLVEQGHDVTLYLIQNAVFTARKGAKIPVLPVAVAQGHASGKSSAWQGTGTGFPKSGSPPAPGGEANASLRILADDFSLRERGFEKSELEEGIETAEIGTMVDLLMEEGRKALWH